MDAHKQLEHLDVKDRPISVAIAALFRHGSAEQQRLFRLLNVLITDDDDDTE